MVEVVHGCRLVGIIAIGKLADLGMVDHIGVVVKGNHRGYK